MAEPCASVDVAVWLDQAIVAALLLIPGSYLVWLNSSQFHGSRWVLAGIFAVPGILIAIRWSGMRRVAGSRFDRVVATGFLTILAVGFANAIRRSEFPGNVLSVYGQELYWIALAVIFLKLTAVRSRTYVLTLIRRYYLIVAGAAWLFALLWLIAGQALPHGSVITPTPGGSGQLLAYNYYLSLVYTFRGYGVDVPRFTFLYREPRMLAMGLTVGLMLQIVHLGACLRSGRRKVIERAVAGFLLMLGAMVLTGSLYGWILVLVLVGELVVYQIWPRRYWRGLRSFHFAAIVAGVAVYATLNVVIGGPARWPRWQAEHQQTIEAAAHAVDKPTRIVDVYLRQRMVGMWGLMAFPLGTGTMNRDSPRFERQYGVATTGGETVVQWALENAGLLGLFLFAIVAWRFLGVLARQRSRAADPEVRGACLLMAELVVVGALVLDLLLPGARGVLLAGVFILAPGRRGRDPVAS